LVTNVYRQHGWNRICNELHSRCDIHTSVQELPHPAASLLDRIRRNGVPVVLAAEPWTGELKDERFTRGPRKSADEHIIEFLQKEKRVYRFLPDRRLDFTSVRGSQTFARAGKTITTQGVWCHNGTGACASSWITVSLA
jgi:hypothetical protein